MEENNLIKKTSKVLGQRQDTVIQAMVDLKLNNETMTYDIMNKWKELEEELYIGVDMVTKLVPEVIEVDSLEELGAVEIWKDNLTDDELFDLINTIKYDRNYISKIAIVKTKENEKFALIVY